MLNNETTNQISPEVLLEELREGVLALEYLLTATKPGTVLTHRQIGHISLFVMSALDSHIDEIKADQATLPDDAAKKLEKLTKRYKATQRRMRELHLYS